MERFGAKVGEKARWKGSVKMFGKGLVKRFGARGPPTPSGPPLLRRLLSASANLQNPIWISPDIPPKGFQLRTKINDPFRLDFNSAVYHLVLNAIPFNSLKELRPQKRILFFALKQLRPAIWILPISV